MSLLPQAMVFGASLLGASGQIFFKRGAESFKLSLELIRNWNFLIGAGLYFVALIITMFAYKKADVSILYPIVAFSYVFTIILAGIFLKEPITVLKIVGAVVIMGGVVIINL